MKRTSGPWRAWCGSSAPLFGAWLVFAALGACQSFKAGDGSGGASAGTAGDASAGRSGAAGSAGDVSSNGGSQTSAGSAGMPASSGGSAGDAVAGGGTGGIIGAGGVSIAGGGAPPVSECPCFAPTPTCEAGRCVARGPAMIKVDGYYIDSTEVTAAQYAIFSKLKGTDTSGQTPECAWNTSYDPVFEQGAAAPAPDHPVTNIDFCDAEAYCAWADERLCGKISGGTLGLDQTASPALSQWFAACAGPDSQQYPYGKTYDASACNDNSMALQDVTAKEKCQGYYPGLYDMIGNAQEWVDSCNANQGKADTCERIGGSYLTGSTVICSTSGAAERGAYAQSVGFRCCSKATAK